MNWLSINIIKQSFTDYNICILDNNFNEKTITKNKYIKLNKNEYEIIEIYLDNTEKLFKFDF